MARSEYVYVVVNTDLFGFSRLPVAAFTVKHELKTWLENQGSIATLHAFRLQDGRTTRPAQEIPIKEIVNG